MAAMLVFMAVLLLFMEAVLSFMVALPLLVVVVLVFMASILVIMWAALLFTLALPLPMICLHFSWQFCHALGAMLLSMRALLLFPEANRHSCRQYCNVKRSRCHIRTHFCHVGGRCIHFWRQGRLFGGSAGC